MMSSNHNNSSNSLHNVADLNNQGVALLATGEADKAVGFFKEALAIMKDVVFEPDSLSCWTAPSGIPPQQDPNMTGGGAFMQQVLSQSSASSPTASTTTTTTTTHVKHSTSTAAAPPSSFPRNVWFDPRRQIPIPVPGLQDRDSFIYHHALTCLCDMNSEDLEYYIHVHGATVIFNMALAHHSKGRSRGLTRLLRKAILLYDMCLALLENGPYHGTATLVKVASLNNKAQIFYESGDYVEARRWLDQLSSVMMATGQHQQQPHNGALVLDERDVEGFLLNVLLLNPPHVAQAA